MNPDGMPKLTDDFLNKQQRELRPIIAEAICRGMSKEELSAVLAQVYDDVKMGHNKE